MTEWISVHERLPEENVRVLVSLGDRLPYIDTDRRYLGSWVRWDGNITHWMELPEQPDEE